jgi:AraC-like DNA-binding protein
LYFDGDAYPDLPKSSAIVEINALLRELILRITEWTDDSPLTRAQHRLIATLLDELACASIAPLYLPMPRSKKLLSVAQGLIDDPSSSLTLAEWGKLFGASERTLARGFLEECGLTFSQWRTQYRLLVARTRLAEGDSVTSVAHAIGYASDSAFIAMYRKLYGESPGRSVRVKIRNHT